MNKIKSLSLVLSSIFLAGGSFAADSLQSLQAQVDALNAQLNTIDTTSEATSMKSRQGLAKIGQAYQQGKLHLDEKVGFYIDAQPSVTYELALLQQMQQHPFEGLAFGGYFEQDNQYWNGDSIATTSNTTYSHGTGIYFTGLDLDFLAKLNDWASVLIRPEIQNLGTSSESYMMHDAFVTFGNLDKFPLYATVGKTYIPFGTFSGGGVWDVALTRAAFRPGTTNQVIFGYYEQGLGTSLSFFNAPGFGSQVSHFAYRFGYNGSKGPYSYGVGLGYLSDLRGTSSGLGSQFSTGGTFSNANNTRNPVYDINGTVGYSIVEFDAEWLTTQRDIFTTAGANQGKPQAWNIDGSVSPGVYGKPLSFMLGYSHTSHMQGTAMSLNGDASPGYATQSGFSGQWNATVTRQILSGYYLGFEAARDKLYNGQKTYEFTIDNSVYF